VGDGSVLKPGIYALASLDGSPISDRDREALGLAPRPEVREVAGLAARCVESPSRLSALHVHVSADTLLAFAGYLDEPEDLARELNADPQCSFAELAATAMDRFGPAAPARMHGEWSLLRWCIQSRELTLLNSETVHDTMFWATNGSHVAVAPDLLQLGRLSWVGLVLYPEGLALGLGKAPLRRIRGNRTIWKGIYAVEHSTREVFLAGSQTTMRPAPEPASELWTGTFEDAVAALNVLCRRIVGQNLRRYGPSALLLSGGLDSTLLTVLAAQERGQDTDMVCLTSVAPPGTGLKDEREFSAAVADRLGLRLCLVHPPAQSNVYRPAPENFAFTGQMVPSVRHYLQDALQARAHAEGANVLFDGVLGELTITEKPHPEAEVDWLRRLVYAARRWRAEQRRRQGWPAAAFHARFSAEVLNSLPGDWQSTWAAGMQRRQRVKAGAPRGIHPAVAKSSDVETSTPTGLRRVLPFRDGRLIRFAAALPLEFNEYGGQTRALARAMLKGHVPDSVRFRRGGMPFSPDYLLRMAQQAPEARARISLFREAGVDRWLDLDWLDKALERLSAGADPYSPGQSQAQLTAMAAEFLLWCSEEQIGL